jgi:hypothetical protein
MKRHIADGATKANIVLSGPLLSKGNEVGGHFKWTHKGAIEHTKVTSKVITNGIHRITISFLVREP